MKDMKKVLNTIFDICGGIGDTQHNGTPYPTYWMLRHIDKGNLPQFLDNREMHKKYERQGKLKGYAVTCFMGIINKVYDKDEETIKQLYKEELNKDMPKGLFNDGSKGQWRACHKYRLKTYEWILEID